MNFKFKRQLPIGRYIVDFVCLEYRLIIEADGGQHNDETDQLRDAWIKAQGFTILRFWNHDILQQTEAVLESIRQQCLRSPPTLPKGEGSNNETAFKESADESKNDKCKRLRFDLVRMTHEQQR